MLYTKVKVSKDKVYKITQIKEDKGIFYILEYKSDDKNAKTAFSRIDHNKVKDLVTEITKQGRPTTKGYLSFDSERLKADLTTNYEFPDQQPNDIVDTLNNSTTYLKRAVGYCAYHKRYVTQQQMKTKECLRKQCERLIKIPHKSWYDKEFKIISKKLAGFGINI